MPPGQPGVAVLRIELRILGYEANVIPFHHTAAGNQSITQPPYVHTGDRTQDLSRVKGVS